MPDFTRQLLRWYQQHGRHDLPWQQEKSPYNVWVSEIMLQQTQVATVIPYYQRFMARFPNVETLALAQADEVLHLWSGLGYYSRARNLHRAAQKLWEEFNGIFPSDLDTVMTLPGIGRSTAGAILALSMDIPHPILDGNVKRVLCRYYGIKRWPGERATEKQLWSLAQKHTPQADVADYTQGIMDLGATLCSRGRPDCEDCPVSTGCVAYQQDLQRELPRKKPKKPLPVKQTIFTMIESPQGELLLEKRPPAGIWGGLWSFPECPPGRDISDWVGDTFGYRVKSIAQEPGIRHTFTHFHLEITPVRVKLARAEAIMAHSDLYWFNPFNNDKAIGMATPVRRLVENYKTGDDE